MIEIMCRFPEIKDLIAVLNRSIKSGNAIGDEENVESYVQGEVEWGRRRAELVDVSKLSTKRDVEQYRGLVRGRAFPD